METAHVHGPVAAADNTRLGITVLSLFGVAWTLILIPLSSLGTPAAIVAMVVAVGWAGALLAAARRRDFVVADAAASSEFSAAQRRRVYVLTNVAQALIFSVAISVLLATGRVGWIPLVAALVVGLHFLPLARAFAEAAFGAAGLVLAGAAVGSGITLLATASVMLARYGDRAAVPAPSSNLRPQR